MIVFVDGVDGSGKSTLVDRLLDDLTRQGRPAVLAPPLWTFLEPISGPHEFAAWVRRTPGTEVGRHLLWAAARRLEKLCPDNALATTNRDPVVLVDRGPKTVACSARAHEATSRRVGRLGQQASEGLSEQQNDLDDQLRRLAARANVASVELQLDRTPELALERLRHLQTLTPSYVRYLRAFCHEMAVTSAWLGIPQLGLPAADDLDTNGRKAFDWIERPATAFGVGPAWRR